MSEQCGHDWEMSEFSFADAYFYCKKCKLKQTAWERYESAQERISALEAVAEARAAYIDLLEIDLMETFSFAYKHGYRSPRGNIMKQARTKIDDALLAEKEQSEMSDLEGMMEPTTNLRFEERIIRPMHGEVRIERVLQQEWIAGDHSEWVDIPCLRFMGGNER